MQPAKAESPLLEGAARARPLEAVTEGGMAAVRL